MLFRLWHFLPCFTGELGRAAEIWRQRLLIMMEELSQLFWRYILDRHQAQSFLNHPCGRDRARLNLEAHAKCNPRDTQP